MNIVGFQKVSLLDYPDKVASIIFTKGCNFRCEFCQNYEMVDSQEQLNEYSEEEILAYLENRKKVIDGLVITGGEPTLQKDLKEFIKKVKEIGLLVKLDTNGYNPRILKELIDEHLIDYVAMDIKDCESKYASITGIKNILFSKIKESIKIIENSSVKYEFRTTIVKEYHTLKDIEEIISMLDEKSTYYLQNFKDSEYVLNHKLTGFKIDELKKLNDDLKGRVIIRDLY